MEAAAYQDSVEVDVPFEDVIQQGGRGAAD
jgi:hypothetical protein